jgi:hypothetical protein
MGKRDGLVTGVRTEKIQISSRTFPKARIERDHRQEEHDAEQDEKHVHANRRHSDARFPSLRYISR